MKIRTILQFSTFPSSYIFYDPILARAACMNLGPATLEFRRVVDIHPSFLNKSLRQIISRSTCTLTDFHQIFIIW